MWHILLWPWSTRYVLHFLVSRLSARRRNWGGSSPQRGKAWAEYIMLLSASLLAQHIAVVAERKKMKVEVRALLHAHSWFGYSGPRRTTPSRLRRYCRHRWHRQKIANREYCSAARFVSKRVELQQFRGVGILGLVPSRLQTLAIGECCRRLALDFH